MEEKASMSSYYEKFPDGKVVCIDDEIPFEVPKGWEWCRLRHVAEIARGGSPRPIKDYITDSPDGVNWIKIGDAEKGGRYIVSTKEKIRPEGAQYSRMVHKGDFLLTNSMSFGRPYILDTDGCIHDGWLVISPCARSYQTDFLYFLLSSPFASEQFSGVASGAVVHNLNCEKVASSLFPLPPFDEQKRIAETLDAMMPDIEHYAELERQRSLLNEQVFEKLRKSLLQEAIQGRLVPQKIEEGNACDLLKKIAGEKRQSTLSSAIFKGEDDRYYEKRGKDIADITGEIPFEIPENWCWVRHNGLFDISGGSQPPKSDFRETPLPGYVRLYQIRDYGPSPHPVYIPGNLAAKRTVKGDILLARYGASLGKVFIAEDGAYNVAMAKVIPLFKGEYVLRDYLLLFYRSELFQHFIKERSRCAQAGFNREELKSLLFPLPPLDEQRRICKAYDSIVADNLSKLE